MILVRLNNHTVFTQIETWIEKRTGAMSIADGRRRTSGFEKKYSDLNHIMGLY